jgi:predicted transcriptional regulator
MEQVWSRGSATVRDVLTELNSGDRKRAYTTVMTIMARLDEKGLLRRERSGRSDVYTPTMSREEYRDRRARAEVAALVDEFGDVALVHFAKRMDSLDPERIKALRRLGGRE